MSQARVIEIRGETAGIVVQAGRGYRFFSASRAFDALDSRIFPSVQQADIAARNALIQAEQRQANLATPRR